MAAPRPPRLDAAADEVARAAAAAPDWAALAATARSCVACPELATARQHVVVGDVPHAGRPRFVLVGEAPGATEDETGRPFVGRSGALLDQLLTEAGLDRAQAAVLNVVKCRPPGNRTPRAPEVARCSGWLRRQLELLGSPVVVALGLSSAKWFLGPRTVLAAVRGQAHEVDGRAVWATYHPSAAIRFGPNGAPRAGLLADLTAVAGSLEEQG
ncbi:uracil-DNA glycosylase [Blastococcus sp. MG754426]|uniref:uracil-DNA glycosylase n=1 Tax=unclassified Blastococcus TaxID=2619396 RepID=UPI001EF11C1C|nr:MULTISPECIES: uracil-DNA glycosylase [unclassified Blastococcus]MCF6507083.1 uracil-DNA glycosylase [Blastococcus sp. MG754426]MCF6511789.1 uracil-DNA glycosylase [Blastococcus sp. MG754427]MCF6734719.1 uracil-DNA glycosylase [Blastococcus sp. KM273129]